jgi:hypothetical protein
MRSAAAATCSHAAPAGELIEGAANVKMLCWEAPFQALLARIRAAETRPMRTMLLIEASSMALMFFCTPVACLAAFGTAVALNRVLMLDVVFYVVALLNLPKLWLALFFVKSIKSASETLVGARRIFAFLSQVEARAPAEAGWDGTHAPHAYAAWPRTARRLIPRCIQAFRRGRWSSRG